jgi:hypothetical protein
MFHATRVADPTREPMLDGQAEHITPGLAEPRPRLSEAGQPVPIAHPPESPEDVRSLLALVARCAGAETFETVHVRKDGTRVCVSVVVSPEVERQPHHLTLHDATTGLPTRVFFSERATHGDSRPRAPGSPVSTRADVAALKKQAADFERKKQVDKAIAAYREILAIFDADGGDDVDVNLYNRVGDLLARQGNTPGAAALFERAVDLYAERGFFNSAIALCNKILRTTHVGASVYYKLGKLSAAKGFHADAKSNFLEYADRLRKDGQLEEAFRALKELAELCPDADDETRTISGRKHARTDGLIFIDVDAPSSSLPPAPLYCIGRRI